ncbi:NIM1-interacting 1-like protein [Tanacetum coccineum]
MFSTIHLTMNNPQNIITSEHDQEDDDEKKMEIFFSLIRSFKEARDRRRQELQAEIEKSNKARKLHEFQTPSLRFKQREFAIVQPSTQDQLQLPLSDHQKPQNQEQDDEEDLNLKLSLNADEDIGVNEVSSAIDGVFDRGNVESIEVRSEFSKNKKSVEGVVGGGEALGVGKDDDSGNAATDGGDDAVESGDISILNSLIGHGSPRSSQLCGTIGTTDVQVLIDKGVDKEVQYYVYTLHVLIPFLKRLNDKYIKKKKMMDAMQRRLWDPGIKIFFLDITLRTRWFVKLRTQVRKKLNARIALISCLGGFQHELISIYKSSALGKYYIVPQQKESESGRGANVRWKEMGKFYMFNTVLTSDKIRGVGDSTGSSIIQKYGYKPDSINKWLVVLSFIPPVVVTFGDQLMLVATSLAAISPKQILSSGLQPKTLHLLMYWGFGKVRKTHVSCSFASGAMEYILCVQGLRRSSITDSHFQQVVGSLRRQERKQKHRPLELP